MKIRPYAWMPPKMWHNNEIKQFGLNTLLTAIYLRTSPHSNMIYLYQQQPEYAAVDIGITTKEYIDSLNNLQSIGYVNHDAHTNYVWLKEVMIADLGKELVESDKKVKGIQNLIKGIPQSHLLDEFKREFRLKYKLNHKDKQKGASKGALKQVVSSKSSSNHDNAIATVHDIAGGVEK